MSNINWPHAPTVPQPSFHLPLFFHPLLGVEGPEIVDSALMVKLTLPYPLPAATLILLSESEYQSYVAKKPDTALPKTTSIYALEPIHDTSTDTWSCPLLWPSGSAFRAKHNFPPLDFQVPIPCPLFKGDERFDDGTGNSKERVVVAGIPLPLTASILLLDALFMRSRERNEPTETQLQWAVHLASSHPTSEHGWARIAAIAYNNEHWKTAMLAYHRVLAVFTGKQGHKENYEKRMAVCAKHTEYGPVFTDAEVEQINLLPCKLIKILSAPWNTRTKLKLEAETSRNSEPRIRYQTLSPSHQLPRFFSWVVPYHLCAISTPRYAEDIEVLHDKLGVTHVITLTAEEPLSPLWFPPAGGVRNTFVPVENYYAPTVRQMDRILRLILGEPYYNADAQGVTLVHCGGGKGRAGSVLACYVALFGLTVGGEDNIGPPVMAASEAIRTIREMRSGSIETAHQEKFIASYVSLAWKRYGRGEPLIGTGGEVEEPWGLDMEVVGRAEAPDFIVLIGLQGSGKSGFANMCRLRGAGVEVLSPDGIVTEEGAGTGAARRGCETAVGHWRGGGTGANKKILILDRCNPTPKERTEWIKMFNHSANVTAVWFDYDPELCQARAEARGPHATMPPHRAKGAIDSTAKLLKPPELSEGFTGIVRIKCIANAIDLANRWFGEVPMRKFIRTRHLLDLGSATRDDLVLDSSDLEGRFQKMVLVEEKVDGANLGFSLDSTGKILVQNRSHYISSSDQAQFSKLDWWLETYGPSLYKVLARDDTLKERYVLFGEWMVATHSIAYTKLPGWFLAFDLLDRLTGKFVGRDSLTAVLKGSGICVVPEIYRGVLEGREMLLGFLERESLYAPGTKIEGVVVRWQNGERGKVVRENFVAGCAHWSKCEYKRNKLAEEEAE